MIEDITEYLQMELCAIPKMAYKDCFQKWQQRWEQRINVGRECFEGDKAHTVAGISEKNC
jgi:hypothetical protein